MKKGGLHWMGGSLFFYAKKVPHNGTFQENEGFC